MLWSTGINYIITISRSGDNFYNKLFNQISSICITKYFYKKDCIVWPYGTAGSMILCIHMLFQPILLPFKKKFNYHTTIGPTIN